MDASRKVISCCIEQCVVSFSAIVSFSSLPESLLGTFMSTRILPSRGAAIKAEVSLSLSPGFVLSMISPSISPQSVLSDVAQCSPSFSLSFTTLHAARFSDNQLRLIHNVFVLMSSGIAGFVEEQFGGGASQLILGLANRGEGCGKDARELDI